MDWLSAAGLTPSHGLAAKKRPMRCSVLSFRSVAGSAKPVAAREMVPHRSPAPRASGTISVHAVSEKSQCSCCRRQDQAISALAAAVSRLADRVELLAEAPAHALAAPEDEAQGAGQQVTDAGCGEDQCSICLLELEEGQVFIMYAQRWQKPLRTPTSLMAPDLIAPDRDRPCCGAIAHLDCLRRMIGLRAIRQRWCAPPPPPLPPGGCAPDSPTSCNCQAELDNDLLFQVQQRVAEVQRQHDVIQQAIARRLAQSSTL